MGATFVLPLYQRVLAGIENEGGNIDRIDTVWYVRSLAEVDWAVEWAMEAEEVGEEGWEGIEVLVTREEEEEGVVDGGVEMLDLADEEGKKKRRRVDVGEVVDVVFRKGEGERVAVIVCGPGGMAREVRTAVGRWVKKGRDVWLHEEEFGF